MFAVVLVAFLVLAPATGAPGWASLLAWSGLLLGFIAWTVAFAGYVTFRVAPSLSPDDPARRQRLGRLGGLPLAAGAVIGAALWLVANLVDDVRLATGASPGESHAAAVLGAMCTVGCSAAVIVYAAAAWGFGRRVSATP
ncbi:hypothetical protein [Streptomyces sp. NPDC047974]|uniref:hypothetical protein n=1 Tax=Streptomyces sp. NPDC047974 TaxID=3154343 RepID=UPI0033CC2D6B